MLLRAAQDLPICSFPEQRRFPYARMMAGIVPQPLLPNGRSSFTFTNFSPMKAVLTLLLINMLPTGTLLAQEEMRIEAPAPHPESARDLDEPLRVVEVMPEYPGGQQAMFAYIGKELKYPEAAIESNVEGAVVISFVVERDGSIGDVKVLRGIGFGCDEEAVRVVKSMPNWTPGQQGGKAVRTSFNLPIRYKLQDKKAPKN